MCFQDGNANVVNPLNKNNNKHSIYNYDPQNSNNITTTRNNACIFTNLI